MASLIYRSYRIHASDLVVKDCTMANNLITNIEEDFGYIQDKFNLNSRLVIFSEFSQSFA